MIVRTASIRVSRRKSRYDSVGRFNWNEPGGSFLASGVLISSEWVLTAAHVVGGTDNRGAGISNLRFALEGQSRFAEEWIPHPNWAATGANLFAGWDLGLVRLSDPVFDTAPATLYTGTDELGQVATAVGFGATGTGLTGATGPSGTKRAGQNIIDAVGPNTTPGSVIAPPTDRLVTIDFDEPGDPGESTLGSSTPLNLEYLTAPGDSGGGLFLEVDGQTQVAGITSLGSSFDGVDSDYGDRASFTRVSSFLDWIESTTGLSLTGSPLAGDYNGDGAVDGADYFLWRTQTGSIGAGLAADGNADGVVDSADFAIWREGAAADGVGSTISFAVPEPTSAALMTIALMACQRRQQRHRRQPRIQRQS